MPDQVSILSEIRQDPYAVARNNYLSALHQLRKRNILCYYSGWLSKPHGKETAIIDLDKNGFMGCLHKLDRKLGLDLILHSPGGDVAATETIMDYLRQMFGANIQTFIPQISMSGGTMMALLGEKIYMGKQSNLGPIDPQFGDVPAVAAIEEFKRAIKETTENPNTRFAWSHILSKYSPGFLTKCEKAIAWSKALGEDALQKGMLRNKSDKKNVASKIVDQLLSSETNYAHNKHLHVEELKKTGLKIVMLEKDQSLQDAVLSVHHSFIATLISTPAAKLIQNHAGNTFQIDMAAARQIS